MGLLNLLLEYDALLAVQYVTHCVEPCSSSSSYHVTLCGVLLRPPPAGWNAHTQFTHTHMLETRQQTGMLSHLLGGQPVGPTTTRSLGTQVHAARSSLNTQQPVVVGVPSQPRASTAATAPPGRVLLDAAGRAVLPGAPVPIPRVCNAVPVAVDGDVGAELGSRCAQ